MAVEATTPTAIDSFISSLEEMARQESNSRAHLARLKRCAGRTLEECPEIYPLFYRLLPASLRGQEWAEPSYFLVATLFPFAPARWSGDFGATLRMLKGQSPDHSDGLDRRMAVLLDCAHADLPFRLRQVVQLAAAKDAPIGWRSLLQDILRWEHPARIAQKNWARSYFGGSTATDPASTAE